MLPGFSQQVWNEIVGNAAIVEVTLD
jgi:hypothetical protein